MKPQIRELFLKIAPCCLLARTVLEHLFDPYRLDELFHRVADTQYHRQIFFSDLFHLMFSVVLRTKPSVLAAYREAQAELGVSHQAVYSKLAGTDDIISESLVADSAIQIRPVIDALNAKQAEPVPGFRARIVDGNLLAKTERRLKPLRTTWARGLPGRALAVYEPAYDLVTHVFLERDAHADERTRLDDVLALVEPGDLWIADSHFCTYDIMASIHDAKAFFLIRQHSSLKGCPVGVRRRIGRTATGEVFEQELQLIGHATGRSVRRLTLLLDTPTTDGLTEIHVLTNVPEEQADAIILMDAYRQRWSIEKRFYEVAQTLNAEPHTLCYPPAALFAFCLGLVASNAVALMRAALRSVHGAPAVDTMSNFYVAEEIRETYRGMTIALSLDPTPTALAMTPAELAAHLRTIASHVDPKRYRKARRGPKKKPPKKPPYQNGINHSTQRLLDAEKYNKKAP
jgi:hypothetical protein